MNRTGLTELEIVLAVARRGTFKAAASELEMSPSAVTNAVAALEKRLGVRLFNRTTRSVALTDAGRRFSEKIVPALAMIRSAAEEAGSDPGDPAGMLRLNVPPESSALWYASILLPFLQRYPRIRVDIYSQKERVDIVADGFDAGIRLAEDVPGDMIAVRLTPEMRMIVVAAPAYLAHAGTPQTPEALDQHQTLCMRMADGSVYRWELSQQQALSAAGRAAYGGQRHERHPPGSAGGSGHCLHDGTAGRGGCAGGPTGAPAARLAGASRCALPLLSGTPAGAAGAAGAHRLCA